MISRSAPRSIAGGGPQSACRGPSQARTLGCVWAAALMPAGRDNGQTPSLPVWDRQRGTLLEESMATTSPYESEPQRSFTQWV